jgi:hypothetical protein
MKHKEQDNNKKNIPRKMNRALIIGVGAVFTVMITAAVAMVLIGDSSDRDVSSQINDGDYLVYNATYLKDSETSTNQMQFSFSNVSSSSYTMTMMIVGYASSSVSYDITVDEETGTVSIGEALSGEDAGMGTDTGTETIETEYGSLALHHYILTEDDYTVEQWVGADNGIPYVMVYSSDDLSVTMILTDTNMAA